MPQPTPSASLTLAVFCDFENVAIGAKDADKSRGGAKDSGSDFRVDWVLERLLDKGDIVVKKAYADWTRYQTARKPLHEAAFELVEVPHISYSGKNSADIRLVVDALDLSYTKPHIEGFVVVSGDSDFSPLVSKLRENNKHVIGVGVRSSTSDLLVDACDEFIYYDDILKARGRKAAAKKPPTASARKADPAEAQKADALELVLDTVEALFSDREGAVWGSMVKQTLKRKRPNFSESSYGYRSFNELLKDAGKRGLLELHKDERSGGYQVTGFGPKS